MSDSAGDDALDSELRFDCDLVMKGGITSGVVYPAAIVELSQDHRFHNIGGSSAGAIAAVVTAAAEHGRQAGGGGFDGFAEIPVELGATDTSGRTLLQRLFVPQDSTSEYFDLFWEQKRLEGGVGDRLARLLPSAYRHGLLVPEHLIALVPAIVLPLCAVAWLVMAPSAATVAVAVLSLVIGAAAYAVSRIVTGARLMVDDLQAQLADNMHGLCSGRRVGDQEGLTDWLHGWIEKAAGPSRRHVDGLDAGAVRPLTYGDLEGQGIGLVTLTTNLSQGTSENFPFGDDTWAFSRSDIERLFPDEVAGYLVERGENATSHSHNRSQMAEQGLLKLPPHHEMPVLFGARVSLSFPLLISAIPLWRLTPVRTDGGWSIEYREVWLSDGGICSNMPVHLFDRPLPTRPTYGINLGSGAIDHETEHGGEAETMAHAHQNVWRPIRSGSGSTAKVVPIESTTGLLSEVLTTMQNWSDNSMTRALGVRDRICTIRLGPGEGGMNLDMGSDAIGRLIPRGRAAGENLGWMMRGDIAEHARQPDSEEAKQQWVRHRWTRLRSAVLGVDRFVSDLDDAWDEGAVDESAPADGQHTYAQLAADAKSLLYLPYRAQWTDRAGENLIGAVESMTAVDFGDANTKSAPPYRRLRLSAREDPTSEV